MNDEQFTEEVLKAEELGLEQETENTTQHYTLGGIRVSEPLGNWGRDYWNIDDALNAGCDILKPSVFGITGMSVDEVKSKWFNN